MRDLTRLILPDVRELLGSGAKEDLGQELARFHPADIADLLAYMEPEEGARLFTALDPGGRADLFAHLDENLQVDLVERLGRGTMIEVIENLSADDRADLVEALPERTRAAILPLLAQAERNEIRRLLSYPEDSAGSVMTTEYAAIAPDLTVREALDLIRRIAPSRETIYYLYVVDRNHRLVGVVSLRDLVLARPDQRVEAIMERETIYAAVTDDRELVARAVEKYDLLAMPVVDENGRLVGIVTQDDVMDVLREESTEDAHKMAAIDPLESPYLHVRFWELVRRRATWLVILLFTGTFAGEVLFSFEGTWKSITILSFFFPIIIASGGNSGSQSSVLVIRSLAIGEVRLGHWKRVILREWGQGVVLGLILGVLLGLIGLLRTSFGSAAALPVHPAQLGLAVALALLLVVTLGTTLGSALPLLFKRLGMAPAIMSAPAIAASMDVVGLFGFFHVVRLILGI